MFLVKAIASVPVEPGIAVEAPPPEEEDDEDSPESEAESEADDDAPQPVPPVSTFVMGTSTYQRDAEDSIFDDGILIGKAGEGIFKDLIDTPWMTSVPRSVKKKIAPVVAPVEDAEDEEKEDLNDDIDEGDAEVKETPVQTSPRSVIAYIGAKTKVANLLASHVPDGIRELYSVFIGGGSFEFAWLRKNPAGRVLAYDTNVSLIKMYLQIQENPTGVQIAYDSLDDSKEQFALCKLAIGDKMTQLYRDLIKDDCIAFSDAQIAACKIFVHTKSYMSQGESFAGDKSRPGNKIMRSFDYSRASFLLQDCLTTLNTIDVSSKTTFVYLDPPYINMEGYYSESARKGFPHEKLRDKLREMTESGFTSWMLSHTDMPQIRELYGSFCNFYPVHIKYASSKGKNETTELLIKPKGVY
jgi:site-specific DNA-adenine methylase